jgi:putative phage-type endonuclease
MQKSQIVAMPHTPEWYAARNTGIGASEIAAAAGLSPYQTPLELYLRKRGEIPPFEGNDATRMGTLLEPVVKSEFKRITGIVPIDENPAMYRSGLYEWMTATPDMIVTDTELAEVKTASWRMRSSWGDEHSDAIPDQYLCQTQWQMAVMGPEFVSVHVPVLFDGFETKIYRVERNELMIGYLIDAGQELWQRIKNGDPPEPNWEHDSTPKLIREMHSEINGQVIELGDITAGAWFSYEHLRKQITELEARGERYKSEVLYAIGNNYGGDLGDGRILRRKLIEKQGHTAGPSSYIDFRAVKKPK